MDCVFCGRPWSPDEPHWCLIEQREREEQALLTQAMADETVQRERDQLRRAMSRVAALEQRYNHLIAVADKAEAERKAKEAASGSTR